jgi:Domain of unknown function (DUF4129)
MGRGSLPRRGTWLPLFGVGALLGLAALAAALSSPQVTQVPLPHQREPTGTPSLAGASPPAIPTAPPGGRDWVGFTIPGWLSPLATALCGAVVVVVVAVLVWYIIRDYMPVRRAAPVVEPGEPDRLTARTEDVVAAVDAGLAGLSDTDRDPRRAIIACWLRLEEAAAAAGTPREPGDTSTDLVVRLLAAHRVSRRVLDELAAMYRWARYGTGPVDEDMRSTAVAALRQVRAELAASVAAEVAAVEMAR